MLPRRCIGYGSVSYTHLDVYKRQLQHILSHVQPGELGAVARDGEATVEIAGRPFHIRRSFIDAIEKIDIEKSIASLRRPMLIMHSPLDQVVGIDHASRIFVASSHPKSFISLDKACLLYTSRCV